MKLILVTILSFSGLAALADINISEIERVSQILRDQKFAYQGKYSGEFNEVFSINSHDIKKGTLDISDQVSARKIIERDLKLLNTKSKLRSCKSHFPNKSVKTTNLQAFLKSGKYNIEYKYEFAGKISSFQKNNQQENNLHRHYKCHFVITSKDANKSFWTSYYLKNRDITEVECDQLINSFSKSDKLLVEYKKYMAYRYDTPISGGVYSFHCAINLSF